MGVQEKSGAVAVFPNVLMRAYYDLGRWRVSARAVWSEGIGIVMTHAVNSASIR